MIISAPCSCLAIFCRSSSPIENRFQDPQYGARPLKRAIQRLVEDALARHVLAGDFQQGDTILAGLAAGELTFTRQLPN